MSCTLPTTRLELKFKANSLSRFKPTGESYLADESVLAGIASTRRLGSRLVDLSY